MTKGSRRYTARRLSGLAEPTPEDVQQEAEDSFPAKRRRGIRRAVLTALFVVVAVVTYAYGFEVTDVSLEEINSETRQEQLIRVIRDLARPDLLTFERVDTNTDATFFMPCPANGFTPEAADPNSRHLTIEPACAEPGATISVIGRNFSANARGTLVLVPPDGLLDLRLDNFQTDDTGNFTLTVDTRERPEDEPQTIRAITRENIGSIFDRAEVWQDDNENGLEDSVTIPAGDSFTVEVDHPSIDQIAVALIEPGRDIAQFISFGDAFQAISGPASGDVAVPASEDTTEGIRITAVDGTTVTLAGPQGASLSGWQVAFYDAATGQARSSSPITDSFVRSPRISQAAADTWTRIIETVFLALLATTLGVFIAVPLSFFAARNLMRDISTPMIKLSLQVLALPLGIVVGVIGARWARSLSETVTDTTILVVFGVIALPVAIFLVTRWALPSVETARPSPAERAGRLVAMAISGLGLIVLFFLIANLLITFGDWVAPNLGAFDFVGRFASKLGDVLGAVIAVLTALATAGLFMNLAGKLGTLIRRRTNPALLRILNLPLAALAGGLGALLIGRGIGWLYQISDPLKITWVPLAVGAVFGIALALRALNKESVGIGLSIYYIARTIFNGIRSIEPLIMVIVFVVWVGLGPFAGSLALALHTVAALAKLYSEQVESILAGPLEAVKATGATRTQTIVFAVIPQIVPPYISFTMYRWDINVRMSTIIGFAGGGGIGFLLQQNIRLLNYRAAAVNMLAIAIVVASMDYVSGRLREKVV